MKNTKLLAVTLSLVVNFAFANNAPFKPSAVGGGPGYVWFTNNVGEHQGTVSVSKAGASRECLITIHRAANQGKTFVAEFTGHWDQQKNLYVVDSMQDCTEE